MDRMNKEELLELINSLKIDKEEFVILSTGALTLRGIYDVAKDLDIAVMWCYLDDVDLVCESTDNFDNY